MLWRSKDSTFANARMGLNRVVNRELSIRSIRASGRPLSARLPIPQPQSGTTPIENSIENSYGYY
jgi:hypothetical protein